MTKRRHDDDCPKTLCICAAGAEDEPEDDEPEPEPDESPCNHSRHAWRSCDECKSAYGDLQYQRMKEGEL